MDKTFCTVSTANYTPYVFTLYESLHRFDKDIHLCVLVSDETEEKFMPKHDFSNISYFFSNELCKDGIGKKIYDKYYYKDMDKFRWSMKSVFMLFLFEQKGYEKVLFVDNDTYFYNSYDFLFKKLETSSVLLSPHWRSIKPHLDEENFFLLFNSGLFNGGFVGASRDGRGALKWWAEACEYICERNTCLGQYVDQTHLNLLPIYFDKVEILKHRGCNIASWNQVECKRENTSEGVLINGEEPIVFIHFSGGTLARIDSGEDISLKLHLDEYKSVLLKYGKKLTIRSNGTQKRKKLLTLFGDFLHYVRLPKRIKAFCDG